MKYFFILLLLLPISAEATSGTLYSNAETVKSGEEFIVTITGQSSMGIDAFYLRGSASRNVEFPYQNRPTETSYSWRLTANNPGTYKYCGEIGGCTGSNIYLCNAKRVKTSPNCINVEVLPKEEENNLNVSCSVSSLSVKRNETVTFMSSVSGGTGSYSYLWSGDCTGTSANCSRSFSSVGTYRATLRVVSGKISKTVSCSVNIKSQDNFTQGTIRVNPAVSYINEPFTITVNGSDKEGLLIIGAYYKGEWDMRNVSGVSKEEKWEVKESVPGTYRYCGIVKGNSENEMIKTSPYCIDVVVLSKKSTANECSFVGETKCLDSNRSMSCFLDKGVLKWSSPSLCQGNTSYGYGLCSETQRPYWYCSGGSCVYNCIGKTTVKEDKQEEIETKEEPLLSVSILARKEKEDWSQDLIVEPGDRIELLVAVKNSHNEDLSNISVFLEKEDGISIENYSDVLRIETLEKSLTKTFTFFGDIVSSEKKEFKISGKVEFNDFQDFSEINIKMKENGSWIETLGASMGGILKSWYFWILLIMAIFFFFYLRKKTG